MIPIELQAASVLSAVRAPTAEKTDATTWLIILLQQE
jgi:hypothetical protein